MKNQRMKRIQKNMVDYQIQYERQKLKIWLCLPLWQVCFFLLVLQMWKWLLIGIAVTLAENLIVRILCGSIVSVRHSHTGRELMKYGELKSMIRDVNEQVRNAWFCTDDQALTERYVVLAEQEKVVPADAFGSLGKKRFYLLSTGELERVDAEADAQYSDERNMLMFKTLSGERHVMTVYRSYEEVCEMKSRLEECMRRDRGPGLKQKNDGTEIRDRKRKRRLSPSANHTVMEYTAGAKKIYTGVLLAVILVVIGIFWFIFRLDNYTFAMIWRDIKNFPVETALLAAAYIVPFLIVYGMIRSIERQVKTSYRQLKYHEQQELERLVSESPELKSGDVLYAGRCFWFRELRCFSMHNLILYDDVIWIYPAHGVFSANIRGVDMPGIRMSTIIFYTRDGKRHSILMGDWKKFSSMLPHAILGYGREQKRVYREFKKSRKLNKS